MGRHPTQAAYGGKRWQLGCRVLERGGRSAIELTSLRPLLADSRRIVGDPIRQRTTLLGRWVFSKADESG